MKSLSILLVILSLSGNSTFGQNNQILEFDLYGCWKMEISTSKNGTKKASYVQCDISKPDSTVKNSTIVFKAYNNCEFTAVRQTALYPIMYQNVEGTWTFNKESGIVEVYYPKDYQKEFYDAVKKEYPEMKIQNPKMKTRFKIVGLEHGKMEIENTTAKRAFN